MHVTQKLVKRTDELPPVFKLEHSIYDDDGIRYFTRITNKFQYNN